VVPRGRERSEPGIRRRSTAESAALRARQIGGKLQAPVERKRAEQPGRVRDAELVRLPLLGRLRRGGHSAPAASPPGAGGESHGYGIEANDAPTSGGGYDNTGSSSPVGGAVTGAPAASIPQSICCACTTRLADGLRSMPSAPQPASLPMRWQAARKPAAVWRAMTSTAGTVPVTAGAGVTAPGHGCHGTGHGATHGFHGPGHSYHGDGEQSGRRARFPRRQRQPGQRLTPGRAGGTKSTG
jgi:hypothetical protein